MKSIALVGMGPSWQESLDTEADELWTINYYYEMKELPKPDRVFDIHDLYWYRDSGVKVEKHVYHWEEHLLKEKPFKFYAPMEYPEVPGITVYPLEQSMKLLSGMSRDGEFVKFFTSSLDFLMSFAINELLDGKESVHGEGKRIELYGWSMGWNNTNETEYRYQLPGLTFWTGVALGRGIEIFIDGETDIFKAKVYTYEGEIQMITRQTLETFMRAWEVKLQERQAEFHTAQGAYKTFLDLQKEKPDNQLYKDSAIQKQLAANNAFKNLMHAEGAMGMIAHLLKEVDLAEIDTEIETRMLGMVDDAVMGSLKRAHGE